MKLRGWIFSLSLMLPLALSFAPPAHAQLFGESDEEKAARQAHEDAQDAKANQLDGRIKTLEDQVQNLTQSLSQATGANEELSHQLQQVNDRLDREEKDFSYRLCTLSAQQLGADPQGLNCAGASSGASAANRPSANAGGLIPGAALPPLGDDSATIDASGAPRQLARPPGSLGTLPASRPAPAATASAGAGNSRQFDAAMNLLASQQYAQASAAFRSYADANPGDTDLSSQALYWIGDIAYVQQDYAAAISNFAEEIKKYPTSGRSPDSMLKLGQSLLASGNNSGGCTTLGALKTKYPQASASTLAAAANARKASCGK